MSRFAALGIAIVALLVPRVVCGQGAATGTIEGVVTDASGGVLPGVHVVVKNANTNITREVVTDQNGRYRAAALKPGQYEVSTTFAGFQAAPITGVTVLVGQTEPVDVKMRPADVSEILTVNAETPIIDTRRTDVSNVIDETAISNLPINGRRWENFVLLSPGVTNDGGFGLVSYRGISGLYNNNTVDGVDNNQAFFSEARGRTRTSYSVAQATIKEFQVGISNFSAEFGRAAGGSVNAVTKSGTNEFRGEAFYYLRDDKLQSRDPFAPFKPKEHRQQFGVSAGGPIKPDKIFYFVTYDGQRRNFPYFVNTQPFFFPPAAPCTAPGCAATVAFYQGLNAFAPREGNNNIGFGKIDVALNGANNLTAQYNMHRWNSPNGVQTAPVVAVAPSANGSDIVKTDFFVTSLNTVLSPTWLNEARVQIGRDFESQIPNGAGPGTTVTNAAAIGLPNFLPRLKYPDERRYEFIDNVSRYAGAHSLKSGVDINYVQENLINLFQGGGIYSYSNIQGIASDCPVGAAGCTPLITGAANDLRHYNSYTQAFDLRGPGFMGDVVFPTTDYNWFAQDNWRVNNSITLNLGLRYEYQKLPEPGQLSTNGVALTGNPAYPLTTHFNQDKNNWGPRIGATYDIGSRHATVLRGGWGIYYGRTSNSQISSALTNNAVTTASYSFGPSSAGAPAYPTVFSAPPSGTGAKPSIQYLAPGLQRPEIYMAEATVDRMVTNDITLTASYLYSRGKHLPLYTDTNMPAANSQVTYFLNGTAMGTFPFYRGARPDPNINNAIEMLDSVTSSYNALVLAVNKRFTNGLLFNANYTLSRAKDSGQNSTTFISNFATLYDPANPQLEDGYSSFDRRHRLVTSFHYAPSYLWGIAIGGVGTFESGLPLTATISGGVGSATGAVSTFTTNGSGASSRVPFFDRNSFRQTGRKTIDLRISKVFNLGGHKEIEALAEAFNLFNWTNFTSFSDSKYNVASSSFNAAANLVTVNLTENAGFLKPQSASNTLYGARDMQVGLKFLW